MSTSASDGPRLLMTGRRPSERRRDEMDKAGEEKAIRAQIAKWVAAWEAKDAAAIGRLYTTDGRFCFPNAPAFTGRDACARMWTKMMALPNVRLVFGPVSIDVADAG